MKTRQPFKAGVVQFDVRPGNIESNLSSALKGIDQLKALDAKIALLPEMWSCGFDNKNLGKHAEKTDNIIDELTMIASRYNMIIAGSLPESSGNDIFNTMYLIDGDRGVINTYRKIHLFSHTQEDKYFCAGNRAVVCDTSAGPVGLMLCYDLRFPELCRTLTLSGALLILTSAQWPLERIMHWDILLRARAIENQIFMVAANRLGMENSIEYGGRSLLVSPFGEILARAEDRECVISSEIDLVQLSEFRRKIPCLNERMPDTYDF
ncbi:MAG: carbon-nitrogen family hydrolase [Thermodesulfobacteriota bacterium]|nr:carbon-nitrogen family hydrolase [Thermodesulfobacteriota bacterium]